MLNAVLLSRKSSHCGILQMQNKKLTVRSLCWQHQNYILNVDNAFPLPKREPAKDFL